MNSSRLRLLAIIALPSKPASQSLACHSWLECVVRFAFPKNEIVPVQVCDNADHHWNIENGSDSRLGVRMYTISATVWTEQKQPVKV